MHSHYVNTINKDSLIVTFVKIDKKHNILVNFNSALRCWILISNVTGNHIQMRIEREYKCNNGRMTTITRSYFAKILKPLKCRVVRLLVRN